MMSRGGDILNVKARLALALGILFIAGLVLTNVMANAASAESASGSVSAVGKSNAKIIFALGTSTVDLTGVDPNCAGVSGLSPYTGVTGNEGCAYAWSATVKVLSNRPWTGTLYGDDNNSPTSDVTVDDGSFHASTGSIASYSDCSSAQAVPEVNSPWTWESSGSRGNTAATHSQCAVVDWDDADGTIDSTIQYSASQ